MRAGGKKHPLCCISATADVRGEGGGGRGQTQDQVTEFLPSVTPGEPSWMLMELLALPLHKKPPNITCFSRVRRTDVLIIIPES